MRIDMSDSSFGRTVQAVLLNQCLPIAVRNAPLWFAFGHVLKSRMQMQLRSCPGP
jgi:hypothetical protein